MILITSHADWHTRLAGLPYAHLLQSWDWGEFKARYRWSPRRFAWERNGQTVAAAAILRRIALPRSSFLLPSSFFLLPSSILYVPKGPLLDWGDTNLRGQVLDDLESLARRERAIFVKIDPDVVLGTGIPPRNSLTLPRPVRQRMNSLTRGGRQTEREQPDPLGAQVVDELSRRGWRFSPDQIQFRNTLRLDLTQSEADLLAAMKQKTRYNIRLAERKGVHVRLGSQADLGLLYRLYVETSARDGFVIRAERYYHDAWGAFLAAGLAQPFIAEVGGQAVAALIVFRFGGAATYMYGMSREAHREKMPNHLLQWEAIRWAKAQGCAVYDFWGAPDEFDEADRLWGVWRFKEGFGGEVVRTIGAWDYVVAPLAYRLYTNVLPRVLKVMRRWRKRQVGRSLNVPEGE